MKKIFSLSLVFCMATLGLGFLNFNLPASAVATGTPIRTQEEFLNMEANGSYYLSNNLTLSDYSPINFSGTLDGNGYTISLAQTPGQTVNITNDATSTRLSDAVLISSIDIENEITSLRYSYSLTDENSNTYNSIPITVNTGLAVSDNKVLSNTLSSLFPNDDQSYLATLTNYQIIIEEIKTAESGSLNIDDYYGISAYGNLATTPNEHNENSATFQVPTLNHNYNGGITIKISYNNTESYIYLRDISAENRDVEVVKDVDKIIVYYTTSAGTQGIADTSVSNDTAFISSTLSDLLNNSSISFGMGSLNRIYIPSATFTQINPTDYVKTFVNSSDRAITLRLELEAKINGITQATTGEFTTVLSPGEHELSFYIGGDPNRTNGLFEGNDNILANPSNYNFVVNNLTQIELNVENTNTQPLRYSFTITGTPKNGGSNIVSTEIVDYIGKAEDGTSKRELISFTYYSLFGNIQPSSYDFTITNLEVTAISEQGGLFNRLTNATVKNLKIEDWTTVTNKTSVGILAHTAEGSTIESVEISGYIEVEANSAVIAGGIVGSSTGTKISNSYSSARILVTGTSLTASQIIVGGLVGKMVEGEISNSFVFSSNSLSDYILRADATKKDLDTDTMPVCDVTIGGLVGTVWKGTVINNFATGNIYGSSINQDVTPKIGLLFGEFGTGVYLPSTGSIAYNHTASTSSYELVGAENTYSLTNCTKVESSTIFREQSTFTSSTMWDTTFYPWNFSDKWYAKSGSEHIVLQPFERFTVTLSSSSHVEASIEAGSLDSNSSIRFGDTVTIRANIVPGEELLYKVSAIQKDGQSLSFDKDNDGNILTSVTFTMSAATSGLYSIVTDTIDYAFTVESSDIEQGGVKIKGAQKELEKIEINVTNGGLYEFEAVPATNYGFVEWVWVTMVDGEEVLTTAKLGQLTEGLEDTRTSARQSVAIRFSSQDLGNTYLYIPEPTQEGQTYTLRAVFTSQICNMTVRTSLSSENCATIYINEVPYEYSSDNNYIFSGVVSRDADVIIRIEVKDGYEFRGWQAGNTTDPIESFLKDSQASDQTITFRTSNPQFLLIANIERSENAGSDLTWLWWTLGGIGGAGILGVAIWLIIRKSRSADFMSNYY